MKKTVRRPQASTARRILIAGTGGQGVLLTARLLTDCFVRRGHEVLSCLLHGMAQRGGVVHASVMIDAGVSPALRRGDADIALGLEPVETTRALPFMSGKTIVFMNTAPVIPYFLSQQFVLGNVDARYPDIEGLEESIRRVASGLHTLDATALAREAGSIRALNMVMLGCLVGSGRLPCDPDDFLDTVMRTAPARLAETNKQAFSSGVRFGENLQLVEDG